MTIMTTCQKHQKNPKQHQKNLIQENQPKETQKTSLLKKKDNKTNKFGGNKDNKKTSRWERRIAKQTNPW